MNKSKLTYKLGNGKKFTLRHIDFCKYSIVYKSTIIGCVILERDTPTRLTVYFVNDSKATQEEIDSIYNYIINEV